MSSLKPVIDAVDFFYLSMPHINLDVDGSQDALLVRVRSNNDCGAEFARGLRDRWRRYGGGWLEDKEDIARLLLAEEDKAVPAGESATAMLNDDARVSHSTNECCRGISASTSCSAHRWLHTRNSSSKLQASSTALAKHVPLMFLLVLQE